MRCHNCNNEISEMKNFCENCGARLSQTPDTNQRQETPDTNQRQETPVMSNSQLMGVLGLVFGVVGIFIFPVVFGPASIVLGTLALNRRNHMGWGAIALGVLEIWMLAVALMNGLP